MMETKTYKMILVALFAALTAIGAFIKIPTPIVPFTLQFLFCAYAGLFLGSRLGLYSQLLYVGIGLVGVPVFTKGGGVSYIFQPTFGYLLGFILCAYLIGKLTEKVRDFSFIKIFGAVFSGLIVVYLLGVPYLYLIVRFYLGKSMTFAQSIATGFTPYIIPDIILSIIVTYTALRVFPVLRKNGYLDNLEVS